VSSFAPNISQVSESQILTVKGGGGASFSLITSK